MISVAPAPLAVLESKGAILASFRRPSALKPIARRTPQYAVEDLSPSQAAEMIEAVAARRDRRAYALLYRHYAPRVRAFVMRSGADAESAQEAAQETMIMVWRKAASFDRTKASAATWMYSIARNKWIDAWRRDSRPAVDRDDWLVVFGTDDDGPAEMLAREETCSTIAAVMDKLHPEELIVIRKAFFEHKTHMVIAEELGLPLGTVKSRIRFGLARLKKALRKKVL